MSDMARKTILALAFALAACAAHPAATLTAVQNGDMKSRFAYTWSGTEARAVGVAGERAGVSFTPAPLPAGVGDGATLAPSGDQHLLLSDAHGRPLYYYHTVTDRWFPAEKAAKAGRFGVAAWSVLAGYFAVIALMGIHFAGKKKSSDDFFRGGRRVPWFVAGVSIFATMLSSVSFIACPAQAYLSDWRYVPMILLILGIVPLVIHCFMPFFRRLDVVCAYEYLERRFNLGARLFASAAFVVFMVCRVAIVTLLPAIVLSVLTGVGLDACILVCGAATILYCAFGGFEAVVWSDFVQGLVLISGLVVILVALVAGTDGGVTGCLATAFEHGKMRTWDFRPVFTAPTFWVVIVYGFTQNLFSYTSDQCVIQRYVSVKDERAAARSIWANGILSVSVSMLFFLIGAALWTHYRSHPEMTDVAMAKPDGVLPFFIATELPGWLSGLVVAAIFAATISTLSANLSAAASAVTSDFIVRFRPGISERAKVRCGQLLIAATGVLGTLAALALARVESRSLFDNFQDFIAMLTSGLAGLFFIGVFFPRVKGRAAVAGLAANYVVCFALRSLPLPFAKPHFFLFGGIGFAVCLAVALLMSVLLPEKGRDLTGLTVKG